MHVLHAGGAKATRASKSRSSNIQDSITGVLKLLEEATETAAMSTKDQVNLVKHAYPGISEEVSEEPSDTFVHDCDNDDDDVDQQVYSARDVQRVRLFKRPRPGQPLGQASRLEAEECAQLSGTSAKPRSHSAYGLRFGIREQPCQPSKAPRLIAAWTPVAPHPPHAPSPHFRRAFPSK